MKIKKLNLKGLLNFHYLFYDRPIKMAHSNNNNNNNRTWEALQLTIGRIFVHCPFSKLKEILWNDLLYAHNCLLLIDRLLSPSLKHTQAHTKIQNAKKFKNA